jgi:ResB-like family
MIKKVLKYLSSLRFTLLLISLLGVMFLLGLWIPQASLVKGPLLAQWKANAPTLVAVLEALQFTRIYTSVLMMTLWALFFLNLALVMWQRLPLLKNRVALSEARIANPSTASGYPFHTSFPLPESLDGAGVIAFLRRRGFAVLGNEQGFYGVKNRLSPLAFGLFHLSFFLILVGGMTSVYTRFSGVLDLAEGEEFHGELERYNGPLHLPKLGSPPQANFVIKSIVPLVSGDTATGIKVQIVDGSGQVHMLNINQPYVVDNTSFVFKDLGLAPLFILKDPTGREIDGSYVKLNVMKGKGDSFILGGFIFRTRFYPDFILDNGKPATKSEEFNNPVLAVEVEKANRKLAEGMLSRNGVLNFDGYQLVMQEMPFWVRFSVIKEYGLSLIYAGFAFASFAVFWRFHLYRREILGAVRDENGERRLVVAGRSEFYKSLIEDEINELIRKMLNKGR